MALFGGGWKFDFVPDAKAASRIFDPGGLASGRNKRSIATPSYVGRRLLDPGQFRFQENTQPAPPPKPWREKLADREGLGGTSGSSSLTPGQTMERRNLDTTGGGNPFAQRAQAMGLRDYGGGQQNVKAMPAQETIKRGGPGYIKSRMRNQAKALRGNNYG